jgi:ATP-dependent DNA helicase RecG
MKYAGKESTILEFKEDLPTKDQISKTVVAFCNHFGGKIIIGIDDNEHICGIDETKVDELIESLQQSIYHSCTPTVIPSIYTQRIQEKIILIIEVSSGMNKPYFITAKGLNEGTYIRAGSHTMKASSQMIQELVWKGKGFFVDEMPVYSANVHDLDEEQFIYFLKEYRPKYKYNQDQLFHYKLMIEEHQHRYPTLGGLLLFGKEPQKYFPESFIICSHFQGEAGRSAIATLDCVGPLITQLQTAINFVLSRLNKQFIITDIKRQQSLEIPEIALREIIINAVVHRDYHLPGPIKIAIYDDRIEIFSPGGFPGPIKTDHLEMGVTYIRNHIICKIFREAGFMEKLGSGFLTLFNSYRKYGLDTPQVIEGIGFIKCILPRASRRKNLLEVDDIQGQIMNLFYVSNEVTAQEVAKEINVSRQTAARQLAELIKAGKIKRIGRGPAVKYKKQI